MVINQSKYVQAVNGRVFADIARNGCGSNCSYCYINNPGGKQELISRDDLEIVINTIDSSIKPGDILSFCPNTESFKSEESTNLLLDIIKVFYKLDISIQISTKEFIPEDILRKLDELKPNRPIEIFISLPYIDIAQYEPCAEKLEKRLENLRNIKEFNYIKSCLYIKPFNNTVIENKNQYIKIIEDYKPDDICVGPRFPKTKNCCRSLHKSLHKYDKTQTLLDNTEYMSEIICFSDFIRKETGKKVFYSSACVIANNTFSQCLINLYEFNDNLCRDCKSEVRGNYVG